MPKATRHGQDALNAQGRSPLTPAVFGAPAAVILVSNAKVPVKGQEDGWKDVMARTIRLGFNPRAAWRTRTRLLTLIAVALMLVVGIGPLASVIVRGSIEFAGFIIDEAGAAMLCMGILTLISFRLCRTFENIDRLIADEPEESPFAAPGRGEAES